MLRHFRVSAAPLAAAGVLLCSFGNPAQAHHSFAMFDGTKCATIEGSVVKFSMAYPHAWLWIAVPGTDGASTVWAFEGADPTSLRLRGWSTAVIKVGDKVQVAFSPLKDGRPGGSASEVRLPDGKILAAPKVKLAGGLSVCEIPVGAGR